MAVFRSYRIGDEKLAASIPQAVFVIGAGPCCDEVACLRAERRQLP